LAIRKWWAADQSSSNMIIMIGIRFWIFY